MASIRLAYLGGGSTRAAGTMAAFIHDHGAQLRRLGGRAHRPGRGAPGHRAAPRRADDGSAWPRPALHDDDRSAGRPDRCRRRPVAATGPAASRRAARRAHPAGPRRHRPGDPGTGRLLHGPALHPRAAGRHRGPRAGGPEGAHLQLHEPRQHRGPGRHAATPPSPSPRSARAPTTSRASWPTPPASTARRSARGWWASTTPPGASRPTTTAPTRCPPSRRPGRACSGRTDVAPADRRFVELAVTMGAIPAQYLRYYYFRDEVLAELQAKADDPLRGHPGRGARLLGALRRAGRADDPQLDPARSRGGIFELELALDAIDSFYNDLGLVLPVNTPNVGGALPGFDEDVVVEVFARVDARGVHPEPTPGPAAARPGPHRAARRVPVADRRGGLVGRPPGRHPRPRQPSLADRDPQGRGALRRDGRRPPRLSAGAPAAVSSTGRAARDEPGATVCCSGSTAAPRKTVALIADEDGTVLGAGRAGSSDIHGPTGPGGGGRSRGRGCPPGLLERRGATAADVTAAVFCLCGADWPEDDDLLRHGPRRRSWGWPARPLVMNDSFATLRAGTPDGLGVALVLGTGGAIAARGPDGRTWFSGFRIEPSGARGARSPGLRAAHPRRVRLGPGARASRQAALAAFGVGQRGGARPRRLARGRPAPGGAGAAGAGPPGGGPPRRPGGAAPSSTSTAGCWPATCAPRPGAWRLDVGVPAPVVLGGGLLRHPCRTWSTPSPRGCPAGEVVRAAVEPVYGALLLAADDVGATPSLERLRESGPEATFFRTL